MRKNRKLKNTLFIVCEGNKTEPNYLEALKQTALKQNIWYKIQIVPNPVIEENFVKKGKRKFKPNPEEDNRFKDYLESIYPKEATQIYEQNKAVPTRFVKEAQIKLEQEGFNEAWAVFDKDGHPAQKSAFDLSQKPIDNGFEKLFVKIAFSSISFEHWILLHFEKSKKEYAKSKQIIDDELIFKNYFSDYTKNETFIAKQLGDKTNIAIENATWLRFQMEKNSPNTPTYELNPYTNVDELVKSILGIQTEYIWTELDKKVDFGNMKNVKLSLLNEQIIFSADAISTNPNSMAFYLKDSKRTKIQLSILETDFAQISKNKYFTILLPKNSQNKDLCIHLGRDILLFENS